MKVFVVKAVLLQDTLKFMGLIGCTPELIKQYEGRVVNPKHFKNGPCTYD